MFNRKFQIPFSTMNLSPFYFVRKSLLILLLGMWFVYSSCEKESAPSVDLKYDYFPVDTGYWIIYEVEKTTYDDFLDSVVVHTEEIKEVIESVFEDNSGRPTYRIERYKRPIDSTQWTIENVWFANLTATTAERVEDNLRYIKLAFPIKVDRAWNGNAYIEITKEIDYLRDWKYQVTELDVPMTIGGFSFDSTLTVVHQDRETLIEKVYSTEQYAKGVGMVYKELQTLEKQDVNASWTNPKKGYILKMTLKDYRK